VDHATGSSTVVQGPSQIGRYEILGLLGEGGMGRVYRARDSQLARVVAVKVLPQAFAADEDRLRRFEQEARATAALNHPGIMAVFDVGVHEGAPYLVSELLEGTTLRTRIERLCTLPDAAPPEPFVTGSWGDDGTILFSVGGPSGLYRTDS
jgi:hypothetical protein